MPIYVYNFQGLAAPPVDAEENIMLRHSAKPNTGGFFTPLSFVVEILVILFEKDDVATNFLLTFYELRFAVRSSLA